MSQTNPTEGVPQPPDNDALLFLRHVLAAAARGRPDQLVAARGAFLAGQEGDDGGPPLLAVEAALNGLRRQVFLLPHEMVLERLKGLELSRSPELHAEGCRIERLSAARGELADLQRHQGGEAIETLRGLFTAEPTAAALLRMRLAIDARAGRGRRRIRRLARKVRRHAPRIHALEPRCFSDLLASSRGLTYFAWEATPLILAAVVLVVTILVMFKR